MVQHFSARQWGGQSPGRSRSFHTRQQGQGLSRKVWICIQCRAWNEGKKPAECIDPKCLCNEFYRCDSSVEAQRFMRLWMMQDGGEIGGLEHHPKYPLHAPGPDGVPVKVRVYEADSAYHYTAEPNVTLVEDVKPKSEKALDGVFKIKRAWFEAQYGIRIRIVN